ncbi:hypothetical protein I4J48_06630 [Pseudonocardia sp. KRD-169]|uniref:Uncharacterized protein n=1 Tax=Pseudonocardia abyssalis TaxID=2792008 RepID=A0ABS6UYG3_9PSEU|nr:hypothetical protein [Pseudonocardia abyssalis]MBW0136933.1 hypothetical protein [Pseudonocardia abyssalis]
MLDIATYPRFYYAAQFDDCIRVYASPLVSDTNEVWLTVSSWLAGRVYEELPSETFEDPDMMHGQATLYTFAFRS